MARQAKGKAKDSRALSRSTRTVAGKDTASGAGAPRPGIKSQTTRKRTAVGKSSLPVKAGPDRAVVRKATAAEAKAMMESLCQRYPDAECELDFGSDFQLLIAVILSAQTTDVTVNKVTPQLFRRFPDARSLAEADMEAVKEIIRSCGYYNAKAKNIQECARALVARFAGKVPTTLDELTTLPGVGRKTANVVLGVAHQIPGWSVDTHVQRLSKRLGFTREDDPYKIELDLIKLFPKADWSKLSITLIWHGRRTCFAKKPDCPSCPINHLCPSSLV